MEGLTISCRIVAAYYQSRVPEARQAPYPSQGRRLLIVVDLDWQPLLILITACVSLPGNFHGRVNQRAGRGLIYLVQCPTMNSNHSLLRCYLAFWQHFTEVSGVKDPIAIQ